MKNTIDNNEQNESANAGSLHPVVRRCVNCGNVWTDGLQGREKQYSNQRPGYQFRDTGAATPNVELTHGGGSNATNVK
jgi:hypothetical protein